MVRPIQYEKVVIHKKILKLKNELSFPFVDTLLHEVTSYEFDWKYKFSMKIFFLTQSVYLLLI
jgi:hypothetical protein